MREKQKIVALVVLLVIGLSQTSCGYRLRGSVNISPEFLPLAIVSEGLYIQITPVLTQTLQGAGLSLVDLSAANSVLRLRSEVYAKKLLTVATSGESQTHSLQYTIQFEIIKRKKSASINQDGGSKANHATSTDVMKQVVSVTRSFQFEKKAVLSSSAEEAIIKKEMLTDAAQQILRRLNYLQDKRVSNGLFSPDTKRAAQSQAMLVVALEASK